MLTKHNYQKSKIDLSSETDPTYKCCKIEVPGDPTCTDCCYDKWKDELKVVVSKYNKAEETATQAKKKRDFAADKSKRFKTWLEELSDAEDLSRKICHQLEIIAGQAEKMWYNSLKAAESIEYLFCMIRDFYMQVDYLKRKYEDLMKCVNSNNDPSLEKDKGVLKCLADYQKKLDEVIKARDEIIKAMVEAVKIANLIVDNLSTQDCLAGYKPCDETTPCSNRSKENTYYGFNTIICEWYWAFKCENKPDPCEDSDNNKDNAKKPIGICASKCELEPTFGFPICNNNYKTELLTCITTAEKEALDADDDLKKASKEKEALSACKGSLDKAIAEVDPKTRCK